MSDKLNFYHFDDLARGFVNVAAAPLKIAGESAKYIGDLSSDLAEVIDQEPQSGRRRRSARKHSAMKKMKHSAMKHMKHSAMKHIKHSAMKKMKHSARKHRSVKKSNPKSRKSCSKRNMMWVQKSEDDKKAHCRKKHNRK